MSHIADSCPLTKLDGGLLQTPDDDAVQRPANLGRWNCKKERLQLTDNSVGGRQPSRSSRNRTAVTRGGGIRSPTNYRTEPNGVRRGGALPSRDWRHVTWDAHAMTSGWWRHDMTSQRRHSQTVSEQTCLPPAVRRSRQINIDGRVKTTTESSTNTWA